MAVADFTGDGQPDIVATNDNLPSFDLWVQKDDGTFTPAPDSPFGVGGRAIGMALADFNGDRRPDVAVGDNTNDTVDVFLGQGGGDFALERSYPSGDGPVGVEAGDFNFDGRVPDLAIGNQAGLRVTVLLRTPGGFVGDRSSPIVTNQAATGIVIADFDADKRQDLAVANLSGQQVTEFKDMVSAFHEAGLEVILDVVYNHTGEGGHEGPTLSFRGLDHSGYYRLTDDLRTDYDVTGCGNSVDTAQPGVLQLVADSLRYWVSEMGVDGFRFDLVTTLIRDEHHQVDLHHPFQQLMRTDPVLSRAKIIAEPWDLGPYGYQVGSFGRHWSEWNDKFRNYVRDFWRGNTSGVAEMGQRLTGSPDVFDHHGRHATASVNFVTAHDGFTLRDVVTYNVKHNGANGESNRDGTEDNRSWNCGVEGETDDPVIMALRRRQAGNMLATMVLAAGVPMITAGDERGRTQHGNNNAYCQDSPLSWMHWDPEADWSDLHDLTRRLLRLRAEHPVLRRTRFRHGEPVLDSSGEPTGRKNLAWFGGEESEMTHHDWHDPHRRTLGVYLADDHADRELDDAFLIWLHGGPDPVQVTLPDGDWATTYTVVAHTGRPGELSEDKVPAGSRLWIPGRSVVLQVD